MYHHSGTGKDIKALKKFIFALLKKGKEVRKMSFEDAMEYSKENMLEVLTDRVKLGAITPLGVMVKNEQGVVSEYFVVETHSANCIHSKERPKARSVKDGQKVDLLDTLIEDNAFPVYDEETHNETLQLLGVQDEKEQHKPFTIEEDVVVAVQEFVFYHEESDTIGILKQGSKLPAHFLNGCAIGTDLEEMKEYQKYHQTSSDPFDELTELLHKIMSDRKKSKYN